MKNAADNAGVRLDKWLWAARFFKTRALATAAVKGGKVHLDGRRTKPSHPVGIGDRYQIRRAFERYEIVVTGLADRRGPAAEAALLYEETETSIARRAAEADRRRLAQLARPRSDSKPDKKQRRQIRRFVQKP
jgi:ribosome-associated heat shock protein Hsp15